MPLHPLTAFGLILGMMGVAVIFLWGPPHPMEGRRKNTGMTHDEPASVTDVSQRMFGALSIPLAMQAKEKAAN